MDADSSLDHVFFPGSGVVSAVAVYADGSIIEMATIGREGCTAVQAVLGAGGAAKMSRPALTQAMESMPSFRSLMYAYVRAFLEQVLVSVACNGAHSLKQRLARWLLTMRDRSDDDALQITHNLLAEMLGVHRPTITNAARELERAGLIARGAADSKSRYLIAKASWRNLANVISWSGRASLPTFPKPTRKKATASAGR
jgi:CRP-like cAMP-binding protein